MYNITFQQIEAFLTVAHLLNMTKAAEKLYVSQPTLSKTLQRFEKGIGFSAFYRSNQGMKLTEQGEYLLRSMEKLFINMETVIANAAKIGSNKGKILRLVLPSTFDMIESFGPMHEVINRYRAQYPEVKVEERLYDFVELRQQLAFGVVELAFAHEFNVANLPDVSYRRICRCPMYLVMSGRHYLASFEKPPIDFLSKETIYVVESLDEKMEHVHSTCARMGFTPKEVVKLSNFQTLLHVLNTGQGISICGRFSGPTASNLKYFEIDDISQNVFCCVAWYPDKLTPQARDFIRMLPQEVD